MKFRVIRQGRKKACAYIYDSNSIEKFKTKEIKKFLEQHKSENNIFIYVTHHKDTDFDDREGHYYNIYDFKNNNVEMRFRDDGYVCVSKKEGYFLYYIFPKDKKEFFEKLFEAIDISDEDKLSLVLEYPQLTEFINK